MGGGGLKRKDRNSVVTLSQASRANDLIRSFCGQSGWGLGIELDESSALSGERLVKVDEGRARVVSRGNGDLEGRGRPGRAFEGLERLWRGSGAALGRYPRFWWRGADEQVKQEVLRPRMQPCSTRKLKNFEFVRSCITVSC